MDMKNTIKFYFLFIISILLTFNSFSLKALTFVKSCNNCSDIQYKYKAKGVIENGATVIVIDTIKSNVVAFKIIRSQVDDNIDISIPQPVDVPQEIKSTFDEAIYFKNEYENDLIREFGSLNINFNQIEFSVASSKNISAMAMATTTSQSINAFDFMSNSALRRQTYQRLTTQYPNYTAFNNLWNKTVSIIGLNFGGQKVNISVDLRTLAFTPKLEFEDGSYVIVEYNTDTETFITKQGVDEGSNDIPTTATSSTNSSIGGQYNIVNSSHFNDIQEYLNYYWLVNFKSGGSGQSCTMKCLPISSGRYECTYTCK